MVFNSLIVVSVAHVSASVWQSVACIGDGDGDGVSSEQLLDLVCCFPLQQLGRLALCLWTFFCFPQPDSYYAYYYSDDDDSDDSSTTLHLDDYYHHSHSD